MVSVIIPVYNVYEYLDKCMESIVNQTYEDLEIILINDGSTDGSEKKCEEWEKKDKRIRYVSKTNEGLGPTRNLGITLATGEYIMFADSDDWVDIAIVEKLLNKLTETNSEMAVCDRYNVNLHNNTYTLDAQCLNAVTDVEKNPEIIADISTAQWGKLFKKNLYTDNEIRQPEHYYEDAITPVLVAMCKRVCYINEPLYYYVVSRGSSITNNILSLDSLVEYLKTAVRLFKEHGLFEKYTKSILEMCTKRFDWNMYRTEMLLTAKYDEIRQINEQFIKSNWLECELKDWNKRCALEDKFYIWGSYNLMIAMKMVMKMTTPKFPSNHVSFSSIISAMDTKNGTMNHIEVIHSSNYRKQHLLKEFKRDFFYKNVGELSDVEYLVLDFLEERFDMGVCEGKYVTLSDAFEELSASKTMKIQKISRDDAKADKLWKTGCIKFIAHIRKLFAGKRIVVVKMKLAEKYGNTEQMQFFPDVEKIRKVNEVLEGYYNFFADNCKEATMISVEDSEWYYTDKGFRHGCQPWHLNDYMYQEIRRRIKETLSK